MADVSFTPEQQSAIDTTDKSVLVSAAAGSGKTAVLVERIIQIILSGKADVDQMLVVTFTSAAAAEMKLKLTKAIKKEAAAHPERAKLLNRQLDRMYRSYISTFHSFAMRVIKEFFFMTDLEPNFRICDEAQSALLQMEAMEELFDDCFADDGLIPGGSFQDFLTHYSSDRGEDILMNEMIAFYGKLRSMPDYFDWADERVAQLRTPEGDYQNSPIFAELMGRIQVILQKASSDADEMLAILENSDLKNSAEKFRPEVMLLREVAAAAGRTPVDEKAFELLDQIEFQRFVQGKGEKEGFSEQKPDTVPLHDSYKNAIKQLEERYLSPDLATRFREQDETASYTQYYLDLLKAFEERYSEKKKEQGLIDFGDIEHICVRILSDETAAATIRERFNFIFIDEYQDTNHLQEYLIGKIARPDNLFKVGDVKQSIYRFRQSEPQIFVDTMKDYKDPANADATTINLNKNFRSNGKTIEYINDVFEDIMPGYDDEAKLHQGLKGSTEYNFMPEIHVLLENSGDDGDAGVPQTDEEFFEGDDSGEEIEERSKVEAEADHVAKVVAQIVGTEFHDGKTGQVRRAEPRDIVILMRSTKYKADVYYKAMQQVGIDAHVSDDDGYFDTVEIAIAMALLSVIDNRRQDVPLIAVLHSEIFGFTAEELGTIRALYSERVGRRAPFHEAFHGFCANPIDSAETGATDATSGEAESTGGSTIFDLHRKACAAEAKLSEWQEQSHLQALDDYIWYLLNDSGYYVYAGAMYGGRQRQANLRALAERARSFREDNIASLGSFIRYLDILRRKGVKTGQAMMVSEEDNLVRIMTIHKSKGLEFPFVIVTGMGGKFMSQHASKGPVFNPSLGVSLGHVDREERFWRPTLLQSMVVEHINEEEYQEELRVLYVAMTRAREKLILVGSVKDEAKLEGAPGRQSYLDIMKNVLQLDSCRMNIYQQDRRRQLTRHTGLDTFLGKRKGLVQPSAVGEFANIENNLGYNYPEEGALGIKAKYSVTELRREAVGEPAIRPEYIHLAEPLAGGLPAGAATEASSGLDGDMVTEVVSAAVTEETWAQSDTPKQKARISAAVIGTAYHRIMEFVDFGKAVSADGTCDENYVREQAEYLRDHGAIDQDVFDKLKLERVYSFFSSDIGLRAAEASCAGKLWKERPFTLELEHKDHPVLVQGIIDCCFEEHGEMILIDYKSSHVKLDRLSGSPDPDELERVKEEYRPQIEIYRQALENGTKESVREAYLYLFELGNAYEI